MWRRNASRGTRQWPGRAQIATAAPSVVIQTVDASRWGRAKAPRIVPMRVAGRLRRPISHAHTGSSRNASPEVVSIAGRSSAPADEGWSAAECASGAAAAMRPGSAKPSESEERAPELDQTGSRRRP